jgi:hypothetical protein
MNVFKMITLLALAKEQGIELKTTKEFGIFARTMQL